MTSSKTDIRRNDPMENTNQTAALLLAHCAAYPQLAPQDLLKFLHQSSFGCEHLLSDPSAATDYLRREAASCQPHKGELIEPLDGDCCRVHLDLLKNGLSAETFGKLFFLSAVPVENGRQRLEEKLAVLLRLAREKKLPFSEAEMTEAVEAWHAKDCCAVHHSEQFRSAYHPAYRVMKKEYALFLPLFTQIDRLLKKRGAGAVCGSDEAPLPDSTTHDAPAPQTTACDTATTPIAASAAVRPQDRLLLAIEGGSASGKSTLGNLLEQVYGCTVLHMDDFFLRPEQRTPERFAQPGGNVDRERFLEEVLLPLRARETIGYRRFDCGTFTVLPPESITPTALTVIEGAYSMHLDLAEHYDLSAFLDVDPELQKKRIQKRNTPALAQRFFSEWIPLEHRYFDALNVKERCTMIIPIRNL